MEMTSLFNRFNIMFKMVCLVMEYAEGGSLYNGVYVNDIYIYIYIY